VQEPEDYDWNVGLTPDKQGVQFTVSHMGEGGVESASSALPREFAIAFATSILNAALDICICGGCDDGD
jgi:hypothetical protein